MKRLAIISDLHGNLPALEAVLADIKAQGVDEAYHLGDLVGYNSFPNEVVARVRELGLAGVAGNYDRAVSAPEGDPVAAYLNPAITPMGQEIYRWTRHEVTREHREFLRGLPERLTLEAEGWEIFLAHGSPRHIREYIRPGQSDAEVAQMVAGVEARVILGGHTHRPLIRRLGPKWLINPGSVGFPKDGDPRASYALLELREEVAVAIRRVPYDIEEMARSLVAAGLPAQAAEDLRHGRRLRGGP